MADHPRDDRAVITFGFEDAETVAYVSHVVDADYARRLLDEMNEEFGEPSQSTLMPTSVLDRHSQLVDETSVVIDIRGGAAGVGEQGDQR